VADDTPTMACHHLPVRPVYKRKKSRRDARQWFSLLVVEKARVSYHRQSALGIPSELGAWCREKKARRTGPTKAVNAAQSGVIK